MKTCSTWVSGRKVTINDNNNNNCETNDKQNPLLTEFQFQEKSYISTKSFQMRLGASLRILSANIWFNFSSSSNIIVDICSVGSSLDYTEVHWNATQKCNDISKGKSIFNDI